MGFDGLLLPQVTLQLHFDQSGCGNNLACRRALGVYKYEATTSEITEYQLVKNVTSSGMGVGAQRVEVNFETNGEGFYLALRDRTTCISVSRVLVFYYVCPDGVHDLMIRPETVAPPFTKIAQSYIVSVECVEGASPVSNTAQLVCSSGGVWKIIQGFGCECNSGFVPSDGGLSCVGKRYNY